MDGRSISSSAVGTIRARMMPATAAPASSTEAKATSRVRRTSGSGSSLRVSWVMTASVPSEPTNSPRRSYPTTFLTILPPAEQRVPSGRTKRAPST